MSLISQNIAKLRLQRKLTQAEAADKLDVTAETVASWENGETQPDIDTFVKIADTFTTNIEAVIHGNPDRKKHIRQLVIACGILLILGLSIYFLRSAVLTSRQYFQSLLLVSQQEYVQPAFWLVFGWAFMQGLSLLGAAKPARSRASKPLRIAVSILLLVYVAVNLPSFIEVINNTIITYRYYQNPDLYNNLQPESYRHLFNMPKLMLTISAAVNTLLSQPGVFVIPGIIYWLTKPIKRKNHA